MNIDDLLRAGNGILDDVIEAVNTNEYSDLGQKIRSRVKEATQTVSQQDGAAGNGKTGRSGGNQSNAGRQAQNSGAGYGPGVQNPGAGYRPGAQNPGAGYRPGAQNPGAGYRPGAQNPGTGYKAGTQKPAAGYRPVTQNTGTGFRQAAGRRSNFMLRRVGKAGTTVRTILGGLGVFVFGIPTIIFLAETLTRGGGGMLAGTIIFGILTGGAGWLLGTGLHGSKLVNNYYDYGRQLGEAEYIDIARFAQQIGKPEKEVRKDLKEMMRRGYLPQARMDEQEKTLILTDQAYSLYRQAESSRMQRDEAEAVRKKTAEEERKKRASESAEERQVREILERGNAYIRKVRDVNDMIPDTEEMSAKLYRLEEIMHRIFEQVKKQPESAAGLRRFMDYYLPTTEKLLDAYVELDRQPVKGDNITKTKQEIDEAMDVINDAFENLLNSMFENMAWDISSDISVMKTMLAQDGLTEKEPLFGRDLKNSRGEPLFGGDPETREKEPVPVHAASEEEPALKEMQFR